MYKKILIVLLGAIGDVTRGLPLAARIKQAWPEVELTWAVEPAAESLVREHPYIDRVVLFNRREKLKGYLRFVRELRGNYDLVLDLQRHFKSGLTSVLSGGKTRLGFHPRNAKEFNWLFNNSHIERIEEFSPKIFQYQKFGDKLALPKSERFDFGLAPTAEQSQKVKQLLQQAIGEQGLAPEAKGIGFVIGSSWPSRFWISERIAQLASELQSRKGYYLALVGGKGEVEAAAEIERQATKGSVLNLVARTNLRELCALFLEFEAVVAVDSGPMHLAAAMGKKVISLWGSTSAVRSAPYLNEQYVLQSAIGCSPCFKRNCPGLDQLCMQDIPLLAVTAMIDRVLPSNS